MLRKLADDVMFNLIKDNHLPRGVYVAVVVFNPKTKAVEYRSTTDRVVTLNALQRVLEEDDC